MTNHSLLDRMLKLVTTLTVIVFTCVTTAQAQVPGKNLEAAERQAAKLIGTPVFAGDTEIGVVSDVSTREDGRIDKIRVRTASPLGFGERIVEIPESAFTVLRHAVVLDLTAEEVDQFPPAAVERNSDRSEDGAQEK